MMYGDHRRYTMTLKIVAGLIASVWVGIIVWIVRRDDEDDNDWEFHDTSLDEDEWFD